MNQTTTIKTGTINTKAFHRLEKCQRCNGYKQTTYLRHIPIGARLYCFCHEYYQILKKTDSNGGNS